MSPRRRRLLSDVLIGSCVLMAAAVGIGIGLGLAETRNAETVGAIGVYRPNLPTDVVDRHGDLITQFFSEQKRDLIAFSEMPQDLIHAVVTREDKRFFRHHGWDPLALGRALFDWVFRGYPLRGASTITQQLAGWNLKIRQDISVSRKIKELWHAFQMERQMTKEEILEEYLNEMDLGHGNYGVEAASRFYFGKSVRDITLAQSALLVVIYANPTVYSPLKNPQLAKERSRYLLDQMVGAGHTTKEEADASFDALWSNYDWSRSATSSAFFDREDKSPYFSEYVRGLLDDMLFGAVDINRDGLRVETTLDLEYQRTADRVMAKHIKLVDGKVQERRTTSALTARDEFLPVIDMLALTFDMQSFRAGGTRRKNEALKQYIEEINPAVAALASMFSMTDLDVLARKAFALSTEEAKKTDVQGALVSIESTTGRILAMVGGRQWEPSSQFNRATLASVQPGSSFKPLYYSLAIESKKATMGTMIVDGPVRFTNPDGTPYTPSNFVGSWEGPVLLWWALADSKNIPSLKVLDMVGIEPAIDWASRLLGLTDPEARELAFRPPHGYPIGLGVCGVSPLQMARAYATFPNGGQTVEPVAIVRILNRDGEVIAEPEKDALSRRAGRDTRAMTPQTAYIMTQILERAVERGTLSGARWLANETGADLSERWDRPIAGKTGTTDNWVAAWAIGFTPQITTAVWFGFDEGSRSMGRPVTGATVGGPAWAEYMDAVHQSLPVQDFKRPTSGIVERSVCSSSGLLPTASCASTQALLFVEGTEPRTLCDRCPEKERQLDTVVGRSRSSPSGDLRSSIPSELLESFLDDSGPVEDAPVRSPLAN